MRDQRVKWVGCLLGVLLMSVSAASAAPVAPFQLVDNASSVLVDPMSQAGMYQWDVSGVNQLEQQWFWYRVGNAPESSIDTLAVPFVGLSDTNFDGQMDTLFARYVSNQLQAEVTFTLRGASPGVARSDIAETIKLMNLTGEPLDLHFFEYCNLDLGATPLDQNVQIVGGNTAQQSDMGYFASETVETPLATLRQAGLVPNILAMLNDGLPSNLSNNAGPLGPGDLCWAFQWDVTLGAAGSGNDVLLISKDKQVVPEPATMAMLVLGGLAVIRRKRK